MERLLTLTIRVLHKVAGLAVAGCYAALVCLVVRSPIVYIQNTTMFKVFKESSLGNSLIFKFIWKSLSAHFMAIEDAFPYLFLLSVLCVLMQVLYSIFSQVVSEKSHVR